MVITKLALFPSYPHADLVAYRQEDIPNDPNTLRPALIVCPGGGYCDLSPREDEPIALVFAAAGFQCFCLHYGVREHAKDYEPLIEACTAVRYVREHAAEYGVDPHRIFIIGFSAGGHLAASCGTLWNHPAVRAAFGDADTRLGRPDGMILSYPVITSVGPCHRGSFVMVAGSEDLKTQKAFSLELAVDDQTAPAFLWHTANDEVVPVESSLLFAQALSAHHIPFELHVYPDGVHGLALCDERTTANAWLNFRNPVAADWIEKAIRWAKSR